MQWQLSIIEWNNILQKYFSHLLLSSIWSAWTVEVYIPELMIESADSMLKEQHMPASVGNIWKMSEQETGWPFHSQYLKPGCHIPFMHSFSSLNLFRVLILVWSANVSTLGSPYRAKTIPLYSLLGQNGLIKRPVLVIRPQGGSRYRYF